MLMIMTCISVQAGFLLHSKVDNSGVHQSTLKPLSYCVIKKKKNLTLQLVLMPSKT